MSKKLIAVSLFTGAGGMDVGFERDGTIVPEFEEAPSQLRKEYKNGN